MARVLTGNQQKFLAVLFDGASGNVVEAKKLAGYSDSTSTTDVVKSLKEEILDATRSYFARSAPQAAFSIAAGLNDPTELGIRDRQAAAKDILDRAGLGKTEKVDLSSSAGGVFILPAKEGTNE
jgi:hypothetical protein